MFKPPLEPPVLSGMRSAEAFVFLRELSTLRASPALNTVLASFDCSGSGAAGGALGGSGAAGAGGNGFIGGGDFGRGAEKHIVIPLIFYKATPQLNADQLYT